MQLGEAGLRCLCRRRDHRFGISVLAPEDGDGRVWCYSHLGVLVDIEVRIGNVFRGTEGTVGRADDALHLVVKRSDLQKPGRRAGSVLPDRDPGITDRTGRL